MTSKFNKRSTQLDLDFIRGYGKRPADGQQALIKHPQVATQDTKTKPAKKELAASEQQKPLRYPVASDGYDPLSRTGLKELRSVGAFNSGVRPLRFIPKQKESPWQQFRKTYELKHESFITVASRKTSPHDIVIVKQFKGSDADNKFNMLQEIQHPSFLVIQECFSFEGCYYPIFDYIPISLEEVVASPPFLNELELVAIIAQASAED